MTDETSLEERDKLIDELGAIRKQVDELRVPTNAFAGVHLEGEKATITELGSAATSIPELEANGEKLSEKILRSLRGRGETHNLKYVAAGLTDTGDTTDLRSRLWLEEDVVPYLFEETHDGAKGANHLALKVKGQFGGESVASARLGRQQEVVVDELASLDAMKRVTSENTWNAFLKEADRFKGKNLLFISATPQGGGVALMRHALIRLLRQLDVDAHWHVLLNDPDVFVVTKSKIHNVLQCVANAETRLTEDDRELFLSWSEKNASFLEKPITKADVIVIDDPQPSGLISHIQQMNPEAKIIYRSHIQVVAEMADTEGTPQHEAWSFVWDQAQHADLFLAHPVPAFVPRVVGREKAVFMPATTDPLDGLNKPLAERELVYYGKVFNRILLEENQTPLDFDRPYIAQIARFDPSKGIPDVLESYRKVCEKFEERSKRPQLVITGHGSIDDPDGIPVLTIIRSMLKRDEYADLVDDIKVTRLPHIDQLLNMLLRRAAVVLQLSHKEGFEVKVTEALMKGKPVIAYNAGGIPLQIKNGENGFVIDKVGDTDMVGELIHKLLTDNKLYEEMSTTAEQKYRKDIMTVSNAINWLFLANTLLEKKEVNTKDDDLRKEIQNLPTGLEVMG